MREVGKRKAESGRRCTCELDNEELLDTALRRLVVQT